MRASLPSLLRLPASVLALQAQQAADKEQQALQAVAARADKARRLEEQVAAQPLAQESEQAALVRLPHSCVPCMQVLEAQASGI